MKRTGHSSTLLTTNLTWPKPGIGCGPPCDKRLLTASVDVSNKATTSRSKELSGCCTRRTRPGGRDFRHDDPHATFTCRRNGTWAVMYTQWPALWVPRVSRICRCSIQFFRKRRANESVTFSDHSVGVLHYWPTTWVRLKKKLFSKYFQTTCRTPQYQPLHNINHVWEEKWPSHREPQPRPALNHCTVCYKRTLRPRCYCHSSSEPQACSAPQHCLL
jgi:hypothetical protein